MKKTIIFITILIIPFILVISCSETNTNTDAQLLTIEQIKSTTGYEWFEAKYNSYIPDTFYTKQTKEIFNPETLKFLVFVNPSCQCTGTQYHFPIIIKSLIESGIPESNFQIYSMATISSKHPYQSLVSLNELPACFLIKDNKPVYSIMDTIKKIDLQCSQINYDSTTSVEKMIFYSIKNLE